MRRNIHVQLVRENPGGKMLYVKEQGISIYYETTLGEFEDASPRLTDPDGQVEIFLLPGTVAGNALVSVTFPDVETEYEDIAIAPGAPYRFEVSDDQVVEAGSVVEVSATIYDQYDNVISNNPVRPTVSFTITSAPDTDADLDDDTNSPFAGDGDGYESEPANLGVGDASLQTSAKVGVHEIEICVDNPDLGCKMTRVTGVLGQAEAVDCELSKGPLIRADECFDVTVHVVDEHGNPLEEWKSMVEVSLEDTDKTIVSSDFLEEVISEDGKKVTGKLNPDHPAWAVVTVCGCDELGELDVVCKSDTLEDDREVLDVINSDAACIDLTTSTQEVCGESSDLTIQTSILDTCGNKLVDQQCQEGGFANSCVRLEASCRDGTPVLSTDKTCVELGNTGMAPEVYLDVNDCACGEILLSAVDEPDCCPSVYEGSLPMCDFDDDDVLDEPLVLNKVGPADKIKYEVYPKAENQDDFWVSEKEVIDLWLEDECGQVVYCEDQPVDVTLTGEDCVDDTLQVDSPYMAEGEGECRFSDVPVHKVVIDNCKDWDKWDDDVNAKEWTDLPEKPDIVVDKIAFELTAPEEEDDLTVCVYEETEETVGFQPWEDRLWRCADLSSLPKVPDSDRDEEDGAAYDEIHDVYLIELGDRISRYSRNNEYDNQRLGGAIVEPGDSKDFYLVMSSNGPVECGEYDVDYLYFQDYNSPDIVGWSPRGINTHVRDTLKDSEDYTYRNDDYDLADPYPRHYSTPSYGFGDRVLHNLYFNAGRAYVYFRGLVAELVGIHVDSGENGLPVQWVPNEYPVSANDQAELTLLPQPATQVVARNHGDIGNDNICDDAGFDPRYEYDPFLGKMVAKSDCLDCEDFVRDCRPAMACSDESYDINLQVTDGFQNKVGMETEVQLQACLTYPHFIYLGDSMLGIDHNITIDVWEMLGLYGSSNDPWDACFDMDKFQRMLLDVLDDVLGPHDQLAKTWVESEEFIDFIHSLFEGKTVMFEEVSGYPIYVDPRSGHLVVRTDADGKAMVKVSSDDSSMFQVRSFDASFRLFFVPHALDADYLDVAFTPGEPAAWDIMAWPQYGIPADGEQESMVLIRKTDACGNPVVVDEAAKVSVSSPSGKAWISKDFSGNNNYDTEVVGDLSEWSCKFLLPWFEDCSLQIANSANTEESVTVMVEDAECEQTTEGMCVNKGGATVCDGLTETECKAADPELCEWVPGEVCQESDATQIHFVGAPVKLAIKEILHSDLVPADGWEPFDSVTLPSNACTKEQYRECSLYGHWEICQKECVPYGNTGAWVTVEAQDKWGNRVSSYLGDGLKGDPGDRRGRPDYVAERVCVALDDPYAFIQDSTFGWVDLRPMGPPTPMGRVYCGDLAYGRGSFKVVYRMLDEYGQPLDPRETRKVIVSVFDVCDRDRMEQHGLTSYWDDYCNAQEYDENNLPDSETASRLDPDANKIIFVSVPDRWDMEADKLVVAADGEDFATLTINLENEYMDIGASMDATVQSSLLGSKLESEAITPGCYVEGTYDPVNPTSINVMTEDCSRGRAELKLSSTEPGVARVTVTGNGFGCKEYITGLEYKEWFENWVELTLGRGQLEGGWFEIYGQQCVGNEYGRGRWKEECVGFTDDYHTFEVNCDAGHILQGPDEVDLDQLEFLPEYAAFCEGFMDTYADHFWDCRGRMEWEATYGEFCTGLEFATYEEVWTYAELVLGGLNGESIAAVSELYTPFCKEWGVIPLTPKTLEVEFKQAFQGSIELVPGWNFFSVPVELDASNDQWGELGLNTICSASAAWNDAAQTWDVPVDPSTKVEPLEAYWCYTDTAVSIPVVEKDTSGGVYLPPSKLIYAGWNDVGLSSHVETKMEHVLIDIDHIYTRLLDWLEAAQKYLSIANSPAPDGGSEPGTTGTNNMFAGEGYFLYATSNGEVGGLS